MRFPFRRRKQTQPAGAIVDRAALKARAERVAPMLGEAARQVMEKDLELWGKSDVPRMFADVAAIVSLMTDEQLAAFLDAIELGLPTHLR